MKNLTERTDYLQRLKCLAALKPYSVERFRSAAMRAKIQEKLTGGKYDLILCDGLYALANIPRSTIPITLNCHNVEYVILQRYAQLERNPFKKYYARIESYLMRSAERDRLPPSCMGHGLFTDRSRNLATTSPGSSCFCRAKRHRHRFDPACGSRASWGAQILFSCSRE